MYQWLRNPPNNQNLRNQRSLTESQQLRTPPVLQVPMQLPQANTNDIINQLPLYHQHSEESVLRITTNFANTSTVSTDAPPPTYEYVSQHPSPILEYSSNAVVTVDYSNIIIEDSGEQTVT